MHPARRRLVASSHLVSGPSLSHLVHSLTPGHSPNCPTRRLRSISAAHCLAHLKLLYPQSVYWSDHSCLVFGPGLESAHSYNLTCARRGPTASLGELGLSYLSQD
ncbi:hypothetical protein LX32DRAFT_87741 [Colletotrichum zoysiae]|uniref:Uncharacterized protein n=1 Tax=Colletotrichum zoysiae TaxID=1216348 RepID=A0AAD9M4V3_9PEZI|nr:hypothetical protein LX32DRAFT_87741 [Colletotrichum zoysiae]